MTPGAREPGGGSGAGLGRVRRGPDAADVAELFRTLRSFDVVAVSVSAWHAEQDGDNQTASACLELLNTLLDA